MKYFNTLPKILTSDFKGNSIALTNILARVSFIPESLQETTLYYDYNIKDSDSPESVAYKYYGNSEHFWIVLLSNQMLDPQWDWPLSRNDFDNYIVEKYGSFSNATTTVHHYEKIVTTTISNNNKDPKVEYFIIDERTYNIAPSNPKVFRLSTGETITVKTEKRIITNFQYENELNDSKREIKLLNNSYIGLIQDQLLALMTEQ